MSHLQCSSGRAVADAHVRAAEVCVGARAVASDQARAHGLAVGPRTLTGDAMGRTTFWPELRAPLSTSYRRAPAACTIDSISVLPRRHRSKCSSCHLPTCRPCCRGRCCKVSTSALCARMYDWLKAPRWGGSGGHSLRSRGALHEEKARPHGRDRRPYHGEAACGATVQYHRASVT